MALTRQNVNEFKFEQRQAMRFPDRLNHHQHHLTVGRQQYNIRRGAGISANPGKFHIENIETKHTYFLSEASFGIGFMILISLKMFFLIPLFWNFPQFLFKKYFSFDSFPAEAFAGRPRLQPHNNRRSGRTCFDSCSAPVLPFNCLIQYSRSMVSTSIHF